MRTVRFRDEAGTIITGQWTNGVVEYAGETYDPNSIDIQYPTSPTKVIGVGPNYVSNAKDKKLEWPDSPADLTVFVKMVPNCLVNHGDTAVLRGEGEYIHELELGIVIGEQCRNVDKNEAKGVIAGYTCVNEITNRAVPESRYDQRNWLRKKAFDNSVPAGPAVASPDLLPENAAMELRINGKVRQQTKRDQQIFPEEALIEELSTYFTFEPGDIIATGSPIDASPMEDGDQVEVEIEGIGTLEHDVRIIP